MKFSSISKVAAATILGGAFFVGCGVDQVSNSVSGTGLAAYIKGGTAFVDCNKNGVQDAGELSTTTSDNGTFSVNSICTDYNIVITGGTNSVTGLTIDYPTIAPKGSTKISPMTTMLAALPAADRSGFLSSLGLSESDLNVDYNVADTSNPTNQSLISRIAAIKTLVETTLSSAGGKTSNIAAIATAFKDSVADGKFKTDVNSSTITSFSNAMASKYTDVNISSDIATVSTTVSNLAKADKDTFKKQLESAENANADIIDKKNGITRLTLGSSLQIGDINTTLTNGTFSATVDTNSSTKIADFYNIAIAQPTLNQDINGTEQVSLTLSIVAKTNHVGDKIVLKINTVDLTSSSENLTSTIPTGTTISLSSTGLTGISNVTKDTNASVANSDLSVNVNNLLKVLDGDMSTQITALNTYLTTPNSYDVNLTIGDLDKTKLTTGYTSITGTVEVK